MPPPPAPSSSATATPQKRSSARLRSSVAPAQPSATASRPTSSTAVRQTASSQAKQEAALRERKEREAARATNSKGASPTGRPSVAGGPAATARTTRAPFGSSRAAAAAAAPPTSTTASTRLRTTAATTATVEAPTAPKPRMMPSFSALPRSSVAVSSPVPVRSATSSSTSSLSSMAAAPGTGGGLKGRFLSAANSSMRKIGELAGPSLSRLGGGGGLLGDHGVVKQQPVPGGEAEQIKSFLRIRPLPDAGEASQAEPYLVTSSDTEVVMTAPPDSARPHWSASQTAATAAHARHAQAYKFTRVFEPTTGQDAFFAQTARPLVHSVLNGENGLVFAYGVTNAGKTYTIQGTPEEQGIIPRALDLVFASIADAHSARALRPVRSGRVELVGPKEEDCLPAGFAVELEKDGKAEGDKVKVDRNFEYAVFVSYAELYNEKIFDLLETLPSTASPSALPSHPSLHDLLHPSKRKALALKNDADVGIKFVSGLREVRVRSAAEAARVVQKGMEMRQVWGTRMNEKSSRSHAVFTVKVVRIHGGAPEDPSSTQVSRLSIVDLAGSERTKNTGNTGDRLKEAGSINKSLMVLGQCMEVLQANQKKAAQGRKPAMVPFRHSKLTEMFQGFFAGDGRAVMMIHVNPYDTGFDENSHVMKFSAVARELQTTTLPASQRYTGVVRRSELPASPAVGAGAFVRKRIPEAMRKKEAEPKAAVEDEVVVLGAETGDTPSGRASEVERNSVEAELLVIEESKRQSVTASPPVEDVADDLDEEYESDDDEPDALVEYLFDVIKDLRVRVLEAELRCATIESDTRDEMAEEMASQMQVMEQAFADRMRIGTEQNMLLRDRQIDIVQRSAMKARPQRFQSLAEEDEDVDGSLVVDSPTKPRAPVYEEPASPTLAAASSLKPAVFSLPPSKLALETAAASSDAELSADEEPEAVPSSDAALSDDEPAQAEADEDTSIDIDVRSADEDASAEIDDLQASFDSQALTEENVDDSADPLAVVVVSDGESSEEDEDEDEDEEESEEDADSSFDASAASIASPSPTPTPEPSPSKRSPKKPSTSARSSPVKRASPVKPSARQIHISSDEDGDDAENADARARGSDDEALDSPTKKPLRDSVGGQPQDASFTSPPGSPEPVKKKKRKLGGGKKMMTEDEIAALAQKPLHGAEIKRFARTSGASQY